MKTTLGGDRLGSGKKQIIAAKNYKRSTHNLNSIWRSSMACGTLVPFMSLVGLPGDSFDISLNVDAKTLPTVGPLFGSYKLQLDVFEAPIRNYNGQLHMNALNIGNDMAKIKLPVLNLEAWNDPSTISKDNEQINSSCILKYLGIKGLGRRTEGAAEVEREFNGTDLLAYWDIYKNYYANKQEERGVVIHNDPTEQNVIPIETAYILEDGNIVGDLKNDGWGGDPTTLTNPTVEITLVEDAIEPDMDNLVYEENEVNQMMSAWFNSSSWDNETKRITYTSMDAGAATGSYWILGGAPTKTGETYQRGITLQEFPLSAIDEMRMSILQDTGASTAFDIIGYDGVPYRYLGVKSGTGADAKYSKQFSQEGLGIKTYQSDLLNNWISTEWLDGTNGINEITAIDTSSGSFDMDTLNLAKKVYDMLNRIAVSGGSYDDYLDAAYETKRMKSAENPRYMGSLIKEIAFEEVVSTAEANSDINQPLGTLAGRGALTGKHKGGKIRIKCSEFSYIMGIVSITPRIEYSQGNKWDKNLKTIDDFHKPALDGIGFQDLITDQLAWFDTTIDGSQELTFKSAGKQPAWVNYMTDINEVYGNFAEENKDMYQVLARRYESGLSGIMDVTTYIDPQKYNHIFAYTELDAQNFWIQISKNITARRLMSAKVIPNL